MTDGGTDWRALDGVATAWFAAPSLAAGAVLARKIVDLPAAIAVDLRASGVQVRLDAPEHAELVSAAARELGLPAEPGVLQRLSVVIESAAPSALLPFWRRVLDYAAGGPDALSDPMRRDPTIRIRPSTEFRPLRNRLHLDVVRPAAVVDQWQPDEASGPYGVRRSDLDGNEVDLVPGDSLGSAAAADWQTVFSAVACYRTTSPDQQTEVALAAAAIADDAGFPLVIDLRPGLVILDSGKDQWDADAHGLAVDFPALAERLQAAARGLGAVAEPDLPRFVQLFLDVTDVAAARSFWTAALGYEFDRRAGVSDIVDPRRLSPELVFQELDATETERRRQRNRTHLELELPADVVPGRLAVLGAAGGQVLQSAGRWRVTDPDGNEMVIIGTS